MLDEMIDDRHPALTLQFVQEQIKGGRFHQAQRESPDQRFSLCQFIEVGVSDT